jgi:hypothetical protein
MSKYFRTINNNSLKEKYKFVIKDNENCHLGQKKLLFAEIEFLTYVSYYVNLNDCLILYIGSAPGHHINILKKLFPENHFMLYDKLKTDVTIDQYTKIIQSYFTNESCVDVINYKNELKKKYIVYISDIRTRESYTEETSVWNDMVLQQNWAIMMDADFISLKFRLPWILDENKHLFQNKFIGIEDKIILRDKTLNENEVYFLDGKIFLQIYPLKRSTETRLFSKKNKNGKYVIKKYNCIEYEEKLTYFNLHQRDIYYKFKQSEELKNIFLGYDDSYDCIGEYFILYFYLKYYKKNLDNYHNNIIQLIYKITFEESSKLINKFNFYCILYIYIEFIDRTKKKFTQNDVDKIKTMVHKIQVYDKLLLKYEKLINNQYQHIKKNNILTRDQKDNMIKKIVKNKEYYSYENKTYKLIDFIDDKFVLNFKFIKSINKSVYDKLLDFNNMNI